jgi:hypothetical protein
MIHSLAHLSQYKDMSNTPCCLVFASRFSVEYAEHDVAVRLRKVRWLPCSKEGDGRRSGGVGSVRRRSSAYLENEARSTSISRKKMARSQQYHSLVVLLIVMYISCSFHSPTLIWINSPKIYQNRPSLVLVKRVLATSIRV